MAAPPLPPEVQKLREQLLVDQAPSVKTRTTVFDTGNFISRYGRPYSSRRLPLETLLEMRTDAILRFAQLVALVSIFSAKWRIECASARKAQFVDNALRRVIGSLIVQFFESWNMGYQALVKEFAEMDPGWEFLDKNAEGGPRVAPVWDNSPYPALIWDKFVTLSPKVVAPVWTEGGAFNGIGIANSGPGGYFFPTTAMGPADFIDVPPDVSSFDSSNNLRKVDLKHSLWVTNERDSQWGSIWGRPRLTYAFKYWWSYELALGILNRSVERKGDPTIIVSFPSGSSLVDGVEVPNQSIAFNIGDRARSGSVLAVPSEIWGDEMATSSQIPKWNIDYLKPEDNFDALTKILTYLDTMKWRSMLVSELAIGEGSGGTSSRNVAAVTGARTAEAQIFTQIEWDGIINSYMIPQLADVNFPELADVPARKVTQAFGEDEAGLASELIKSMANKDASLLPIDWKRELDRFQISSLEGDQLAEFEKRLVEQAQQAPPPKAEAKPGGAAGTTDTGFYYDAPELITLAEDSAMLAALPKTKHYSDRTVLAQTRLVRKLWHDLLSEQYESFATSLASSQLEMAEDKKPFLDTAKRIVDAWKFTGSRYATVVKTTATALAKVLARAGTLELSSSRIKVENWNPDDKDVVAWARENAAALVKSVEETTRKQLRTFLANELALGHDAQTISKNLREHFSQFPDWRADLIATEETKRYYNAGTLFAAASAGAAQVQALDAQIGPTDHECEKRHGRVFDLDSAWKESAKEHIRGTLAWRIIPEGQTQLSFSYRSSGEMNGLAARFDHEERVIYMVKGLDPATEGRYLERAVDWLVASA